MEMSQDLRYVSKVSQFSQKHSWCKSWQIRILFHPFLVPCHLLFSAQGYLPLSADIHTPLFLYASWCPWRQRKSHPHIQSSSNSVLQSLIPGCTLLEKNPKYLEVSYRNSCHLAAQILRPYQDWLINKILLSDFPNSGLANVVLLFYLSM